MKALTRNFTKFISKSLVIVLLFYGFTLNLNNNSSIEGFIYDMQSKKPVSAAKIKLYSGKAMIQFCNTGSDGKYKFYGISAGNYNIEISAPGFNYSNNNLVKVEDNQIVKKDFFLTKSVVSDSVNVISPAVIENKVSMELADKNEVYTRGNYTCQIGMDNLDEDFNTESYDVIKDNQYKNVTDEPVSTFSIDVDRASYANVRRYINQNAFPPKDAVRVEEMINYFDYQYPQPEGKDPFSVNMEIHECPWNKEHQLIMIGLQGKTMESEKIPAGNFVFLIDVSGSMSSPNKLPLLQQSMKILIEQLRPVDKVAIVVYAGAAGLVLESTPGNQKEKILAAINNLQAGGSTAGGAGINLAYNVAKQNYLPNGNNRVILATDGDFNVGQSSDAEMVQLIESKRDDGVFLTILGFGMGNYKDSKMESLSNAGNGNYAYIDNILEAKKMFTHELWGTLFTIAKDVKIQIEFNPNKVKSYRLVGYENRVLNREDFNNDKVDAGDIGSGHTVTAFYEIIPAGSNENPNDVDPLIYQKNVSVKSSDILTIKLRYKEPDSDVSQLITRKLINDPEKGNTPSENFRFASAVAEFGMLLRDSDFKGSSNYQHVITTATQSKGTDKYGYRSEFIRLVEVCLLLAQK